MPKYIVTIVESERGWGQKEERISFDTFEKAQKYVKSVEDYNQAQWDKTRMVPDWYVQVVGGIEAVEG